MNVYLQPEISGHRFTGRWHRVTVQRRDDTAIADRPGKLSMAKRVGLVLLVNSVLWVAILTPIIR